jgi:predicted dehydrogenase
MAERVRIGVVGAGLIAQCEHIPNLIALPDRFDLLGVCDPSPTARDFVAGHFGLRVFPDSDALLGERLDAVVVASPDHSHVSEVLKALSRGLNVFCEKPLAYGVAEIDRVIAARDQAGKIVQVGYMKRHDPAYEACLDTLARDAGELRAVTVDVADPDAWPFLDGHPHKLGRDLPAKLIEAGRAAQAAQIREALGMDVPPAIRDGFANVYCSSLVHDVNAVHGLLHRLDVSAGEVVGAGLSADGASGFGAVSLASGRALWLMSYVPTPRLADYRERIALTFADRTIELNFPSPYLNHHPTRLVVRQSTGSSLDIREVQPGFGEAFIRELESFWSALVAGSPVRNTVEDARRDQSLLVAVARRAAGPAGRVATANGGELRMSIGAPDPALAHPRGT